MQFKDLFNYDSDEKYFKYIEERERERGILINADCINVISKLDDNFSNITLTDIPYDNVNRKDNGLRKIDKGKADILTFDIQTFLNELYRVTSGTIIIFCGINQVSEIYNYFNNYAKKGKGTVRQLVWRKTNPIPMNGDYIYLSGLEDAIWFKKKGATFNAHCKSNVFDFPCGRSKLHPTEKNHNLIKDLILDNSKENDIILDPCCGSASHCLCAKELNRKFVGIELDEKYFKIGKQRFI